jgi:hypothetical protein
MNAPQPARDYDPRRQQSFNDPYQSQPYQPGAAGAVAPYRRSQSGRQDRSYSRSHSRSRSRSRSRSNDKLDAIRGKLDETFDTTLQGVGIGLAGAIVGGLAGRELGGPKSRRRDMIIGAVVGGLGANVAENKYRDYREEEKGRQHRDTQKFQENRSRSNVR